MSVVACRVTGTGFEIAADSITVRGYTQSKGCNIKHTKLFEIEGMVIGAVGFSEESVLMGIFCKTHKPLNADVSGVVDFIAEFADWKKKKTDDRDIDNDYLFGFGGKVFTTCNYCVREVKTYEAIGAGCDFALAALHLGHSARSAVETAIELSIFCEGPVHCITKGIVE